MPSTGRRLSKYVCHGVELISCQSDMKQTTSVQYAPCTTSLHPVTNMIQTILYHHSGQVTLIRELSNECQGSDCMQSKSQVTWIEFGVK